MDVLPNSTSKTTLSTLSPYVAEFVPKSIALKNIIQPSSGPQSSQEKTAKSGSTVDDWSRNAKESSEHNSRGWWHGTPLKVVKDVRSPISAPKSHPIQIRQDFSGKTGREGVVPFSWKQKRFSEGMNSNWRLNPEGTNQGRTKTNELGFKVQREERQRDLHIVPRNNESSALSTSFEAKRFPGNESNRGQERRQRMAGVTGSGQQGQQRNVRTGPGFGRGRIAWGNKVNRDNSIGKNETKNSNTSVPPKISQDDDRRLGRGRGVWSGAHNLLGSNKPTLNSRGALTSRNGRDSQILRMKDNEKSECLTIEGDGWTVVGSKKNMDEQKERNVSIIDNKLNQKSKEINKQDDMSILISSHEKEKWKRRKELKKERKMDKTDQERKTGQNKEGISYNNISKDFRKQKSRSEENRNDNIESETKTVKTSQEKQAKEMEILRMMKTERSPKQKDVKILLKKNNLSHKEPTIIRDPEFELYKDNEEFPDLAKTSKSGSGSLASDWLSGGSRMPIISYSSVLKAMPKLKKTQPPRNTPTDNDSSEMPDKQDTDGNGGQGKKKKKKKKKPKDSEAKATQATQEPKKTKRPVQLDFGDWLSTMEKNPPRKTKDKERNPKKAVTIATGVLQIKVKDRPKSTGHTSTVKSTHVQPSSYKTFHNILDSTAPVVKRGKEREVPKKKKPSQLKRVILKEREEKRKALEGEEKPEPSDPKSLADETQSLEETSNVHKTEEKLSNEDSDVTINQSNPQQENTNVPSDEPNSDGDCPAAPSEDDVKAQIHSLRFREYCDNVMDKELDNTTLELLERLVMFQDRQYHKDPIKSKAKRRFVVGLREVTKHLKLKKIKLVIISPNVERIKSAGGLDDTLHNIITIAHQNGVPVVFALRRQVLGRVLHKKVPVSAIGVFYYDGAQDEYKKLMNLTEKARDVYAQRWKTAHDELMERIRNERAVEISRDVEDEDSSEQCVQSSRDEGLVDGEITTEESKDEVNTQFVYGDIESDLGRVEGKEGWNKESESNRIKDEIVHEEENETKDENLHQKELSGSEEGEDEKESEEGSINSEIIEVNETNEIENDCSNNTQSVAMEMDLAVEDLELK